MDFLWFVITVGVLVVVHELGHLAAAKARGVHVLTFSLGFGPRLWGFTRGGTEYRVGLVPLGGYVRMLGEGAEAGADRPAPRHSFRGLPLGDRLLVVFAGPAMNLLLPVVVFFVVAAGVTEIPAPVVGTVFPGRPADGKLLPGDRVLSVDGERVHSFDDLARIVARSPGKKLRFVVEHEAATIRETDIVPLPTAVRGPLALVETVGRVGVMPHQPSAVIGILDPSGPAAQSGLRTFDRVVRVGATQVDRYLDLERVLAANRGALAPTTYFRPAPAASVLGGYATLELFEPHVAALAPRPGRGEGAARAGLEVADAYVRDVGEGTPASRAGLMPGDRLLRIDDRSVAMWSTLLEALAEPTGAARTLIVRRGADTLSLTLQPGPDALDGRGALLGASNWMPMRVPHTVEPEHRLLYAGKEAFGRTWDLVRLTVVSLLRLVEGRIPLETIGGPLSMLEAAGSAARDGTSSFLLMLAFVSINLGVINLLPIPMLDGGQAALELFTSLRGRALSARVERGVTLAGLVVLLGLMVLALKNDVARLFGRLGGETEAAPLAAPKERSP